MVVRLLVAVKGEAKEAHVGVRHGGDAGRGDQVAFLVVSENSLAFRVEMATVRRVGKEVAGARRDVDQILVDRNAEGMPRGGHCGEDRDVAKGGAVGGLAGVDRADPGADGNRPQE